MSNDNDGNLEEELERLEWVSGSISKDKIKSELERLRAENDALKKTKSNNITFKVGQKGGMSMYGLGRFPVTLYKMRRNGHWKQEPLSGIYMIWQPRKSLQSQQK